MTEFVRLFGVFCFICVCFGQVSSVVQHHRKICIYETFTANCGSGKVILIVEAHFGRMRNDSGCLFLRPGERPCLADAQLFAERQCSGRRSCSINPNDDNLKHVNGSCNKYDEKFLDIAYTCQDVYSADDETCVSNGSLMVSERSGYLASVVVDETGKGSSLCPWRFQPGPGESVNLTLMDFGVWEDRGERGRRGICRIYASIRYLPSTTNAPPVTTPPTLVCGGEERERTVITTTSHLEIQMTNKSSDSANAPVYFLFKFQVFNCSDIKTPPGAEVEQLGGAIRVFCSGERRIHQDLSCVAGQWTPPLNLTCPTSTAGPPPSPSSSSSSSGSESLCPEYVRSNGVSSVEPIESSSLRVLCVNGDSFEAHCSDGKWRAAQNKNCSSSEQTASLESFSWEKYLVPGGLLLLAVVVVIIVVVMCFNRRNKTSKMNEMTQLPLGSNSYVGGGGGDGSALRPMSGDYDVLDEFGMQTNGGRGSIIGAPAAAAGPGGGGGCSSSGYSVCGGAPRVHQTLPRNDPWGLGYPCMKRRSDSLPVHRRLPEPHEYTTTLPRDSTYLVPKEDLCGGEDPHHYDTVKGNA